MTGLTERALLELADDPLAVARQAPPELLWCPEHPAAGGWIVAVGAPRRCGTCHALLQLRPKATP